MNKTFAERAREQSKKLAALIDAAHLTGYYAAVMEHAELTKAERDEYRDLHADALARRDLAREALEIK